MYYVLQSCTMLVSHVVVMLAIAVSHQRTSLTVSLHGGCDWPDPVLDMIGFGLYIYIYSLFLSAPRAAGSRLRLAAHRLRKLCDPSALVPLRRAPVALHTVYRLTCLFNAYQVFFIKTSCSHDGFAQLGQGNLFLHLSLSLFFVSSGQSGKATSFLGPVLLVLVVVVLVLLLLLVVGLLVVVVVALS